MSPPPFNKLLWLSVVGAMLATPLFVEIPVFANVMLHACLLVFVGCWDSVATLHITPHEGEDLAGDTPDKKDQAIERLSSSDAYAFPIIGSVVLFSLHMAIKFFGPDVVSKLVFVYFSIVSVFSFNGLLAPKNATPLFERRYTLPLLGNLHIFVSLPSILITLVSLGLSYSYHLYHHYLVNNIIAAVFSLQALSSMSIGSYKIGIILLLGLFCYDIFWVFGTEVMVSVATNIDAPIKLLFPRFDEELSETGDYKYSLLGLGDIVVPGIFVALLLRFDLSHFSGPTPTFSFGFVGYCLGMAVTLGIMFFFKHGQPALFYLVPGVVGGSLLASLFNKSFKAMVAYSEEEEEAGGEEKPKEE
jgi:minor histocompatibility antigen H13